ncbi:hypothetical protein BGX24_007514 [Mortierella sp. AD032]|nr:hypothetical protein BGX24_007514 [Mortierella sp. AD032]
MSQPMTRQPGLFGQMAATAAGVAVGHSVGHAVTVLCIWDGLVKSRRTSAASNKLCNPVNEYVTSGVLR